MTIVIRGNDRKRWTDKLVALGAATLLIPALAACTGTTGTGGDTGTETGTGEEDAIEDVEGGLPEDEQGTEQGGVNVYDGPYDSAASSSVTNGEWVGLSVSLDGQVGEVISDQAFTLEGEGGAQPLLVILQEPVEGVSVGEDVIVSGTVEENFSAADVQADAEQLSDWEGEPYLDVLGLDGVQQQDQ